MYQGLRIWEDSRHGDYIEILPEYLLEIPEKYKVDIDTK